MNWYLVQTWHQLDNTPEEYSVQAHTAEDAITIVRVYCSNMFTMVDGKDVPTQSVRSIHAIMSPKLHSTIIRAT